MKWWITIIKPWTGNNQSWFYEKSYQASIHPLVKFFLQMSPERIAKRYCHTHPLVQEKDIIRLLLYRCEHFLLAWSDLMYVTNENNKRSMVVIENNSCPSGQKSMPNINDSEHLWYETFVWQVLVPRIQKKTKKKQWKVAVIVDKNYPETTWFAHTLSDLLNEEVIYIDIYWSPELIRNNEWRIEFTQDWWKNRTTIRACMRYVTQKPWKHLPVICKTLIINPILACLAWWRNKLVANKAYEQYNNRLKHLWLRIVYPETVNDVKLEKVKDWIVRRWGFWVIKNPYSNAWQGVYTITSQKELDDFYKINHEYDSFIVQSLIWNYNRSSNSWRWKFYHVWTLPNKHWESYVFDLRMRICNTSKWFIPLTLHARKALKPLPTELKPWEASRDYLWTNLSVKHTDWTRWADSSRLLLADTKDFNQLWVWIDDLIEWYIQSVLSTIAIDRMAKKLISKDGLFRQRYFSQIDNDPQLINEILVK